MSQTHFCKPKHTPSHHLKLTLAVCGTNDRRHLVEEDVRQRWQVAAEIASHGEEPAHRILLRVML